MKVRALNLSLACIVKLEGHGFGDTDYFIPSDDARFREWLTPEEFQQLANECARLRREFAGMPLAIRTDPA